MNERAIERYASFFSQLSVWGLILLAVLSSKISVYLTIPFLYETLIPGKTELVFRIGMVLCYILISCIMASKNRAGLPSLFVAACVPFGVFLEISKTIRYHKISLWIMATFTFLLLYALILFRSPIRNPDRWRYVIQKRTGQFIAMAKVLLGAGLVLVVLLNVTASLLQIEGKSHTEMFAIHGEDIQSPKEVPAYYQELEGFRVENWDSMGTEERLNLLQFCADVEAAYYGIQPTDVSTDFFPVSLLGFYQPDNRTVHVNRFYVEELPPCISMSIILHEQHHAFQHELVQAYQLLPEQYAALLPVRKSQEYAYEFSHYIDGESDFADYSSQRIEEDAREAEEARTTYYCKTYGIEQVTLVDESMGYEKVS